MIKFKISLSLIFCLVLFAFSEFTFGQSDSLDQFFQSYQQFIGNTPTLNYSTNSEKNQSKHNPDSCNINSSSCFLYFFNDSIVYGKKIVLKTPFLSRNKFIIDDKAYFANRVKFYNADAAFNANMKKEGKAPRFIKREFCGKINYYEQDYFTHGYHYSIGHFSDGNYSPGFYMPPQQVIIQYYNFGYGDIKKATYKNLLKDIGQNQNSKYYLDKYKRKKRTENIIGIAGTGLTIMSFFFIGSNPVIGGVSLLSGTTLLTIDLFLILGHIPDKVQHLGDAIRAYNY